jgi:hypothetical protein
VTSLGTLDQAETGAQAKELITKLAPDLIRHEPRAAPLFKAAVMLFTDRALLEHGKGQVELYWRQLNIAVAWSTTDVDVTSNLVRKDEPDHPDGQEHDGTPLEDKVLDLSGRNTVTT